VALPGEPSGTVGQFSGQACASAVPHFSRKFPHGLLSDGAAFTAGKGSAGVIERRQKLHAPAFAFYRLFLHYRGSYPHPTPKVGQAIVFRGLPTQTTKNDRLRHQTIGPPQLVSTSNDLIAL
jgi:hypothetical protein